MEDSTGFRIKSDYSDNGPSIVIEDDGRVCYAYYIAVSGEIVGDVWLYNRCKAPVSPEWVDSNKAPFANPVEFVHQHELFSVPSGPEDFRVKWLDELSKLKAEIFLKDLRIGELAAGSKPGFALAAFKNGPLARAFETSNS